MISFSYRISCIISVPKQAILAHAFHYQIDQESINETHINPATSQLLLNGQTLSQIFEPMIEAYAASYGLDTSDIIITNYQASSGNPDVTVSFLENGVETKFMTTDPAMQIIAYYHVNSNLGYGLELYEYISTLPDNTYSMRIGKEVPEGDVNLAFVHTPALNPDENLSFIDTSFIDDNVIPADQLESIVIPDQNGILSYAEVRSELEPLVKRTPFDRFPSKDIELTHRFMNNNAFDITKALFYKFELFYHYDSIAGVPGQVSLYRGSQIQITDENGNILNPSQYPYRIYVRCMEQNPKIYWVKIYLQNNTDETTTFKVRYNHVDSLVPDDQLKSVQRTVELYANDSNSNLIEGGKLRIINGISAYEPTTKDVLSNAHDQEELYVIESQPDQDGYLITIPQRAQADPRTKSFFNYKLSGSYVDDLGNTHIITFGYVTDWVINPEALLPHEQIDYSQSLKSIGLKYDNHFLDAKQLIEMMMPLDLPALPDNMIFTIEDAAGQLIYTTEKADDNPDVITTTDSQGAQVPTASTVKTSQTWAATQEANVEVVNNPIRHVATIFPEQQQNEWHFSWEASGEGHVDTVEQYHNKYKVSQDIYIMKENTKKLCDVFSSWNYLGPSSTKGAWNYTASSDTLMNTANVDPLCGYYDESSINRKDYRFSTIVQVQDGGGDDDVISILFRLKDTKHFYAFMWQRDAAQTTGTVGHRLVGSRGEGVVCYPASSSPDPAMGTNSISAYLNWPDSFQQKNKKIFKATPSALPAYSASLAPNCRYMQDENDISYSDITAGTNYNPKGWVPGEKYKITVVCTGWHYQVYISMDLSDLALGTLVCEAFDESYLSGTAGIAILSQPQVAWSKLTFTEVQQATVSTGWLDLTLYSHEEVKINDTTAEAIMKPLTYHYVELLYGNFPYIENSAYVTPYSQDLNIRVRSDGYIWAQTDTYSAGGILHTPWKTSDTGNNIKGIGHAWIQGDNTIGYEFFPSVLTNEHIPGNVLDFQWTQIWQTGGDTVTLSIGKDSLVQAEAKIQPIVPIGTPYTLPEDQIFKHDGLKHLADLFGNTGIYDLLNIPSAVPLEQLMLRIERGDVNGQNMEHRVNYRWHYTVGNIERMEVDQLYSGVNRLRLSNFLQADKQTLLQGLLIDLVAWTNFEELESVPVLAVKIEENRKIQAEKPRVEGRSAEVDNWYIRIKNGHVRKRLKLPYYEKAEKIPQLYLSYPELISFKPDTPDQLNEVILDYTIPEYTNQEFYHRPYMLVDQEYPTILNETMIQTRYAPIVLNSDVGISYLEVQAIGMNSARKLKIADVDAKKGIIYLQDKIREQDDVIVQYAYQEDWYTYRGYTQYGEVDVPVESMIDFNATFNASLSIDMTFDDVPIVTITPSMTADSTGKYCYTELQNGMAAFSTTISDDHQVGAWHWSSSSNNTGGENVSSLMVTSITRDILVPVDVPAQVVDQNGVAYIPSSSLSVTVVGYDTLSNYSYKVITVEFYDCQYSS